MLVTKILSPTYNFLIQKKLRVNCIEFSNENELLSQQSVNKVQQNVMHHIKRYKPLKKGNISSCSKFQLIFEYVD